MISALFSVKVAHFSMKVAHTSVKIAHILMKSGHISVKVGHFLGEKATDYAGLLLHRTRVLNIIHYLCRIIKVNYEYG
jgi:hypothetical protein